MAESTFDPDLFASLIEDVSRLKVGAGIDQVEVKPVETATRIKEKLLEKFDQYQLPRMSLAEFYEYALLETRQRLDAATERNQRRRAAGMLIVNADTELYKRNLKTWTCQENNINFGYDFAENRFDMEKPLSFSGEVNIEDYENQYIEYFGDSKMLSLANSLLGLLRCGERYGFNYKHLTELFHQFLVKYQPELKSAAMRFLTNNDARGIFSLLAENVNNSSERMKIEECRQNLTRPPNSPLAEVMAKVKSLAMQLLTLSNPDLQGERKEKKANFLAQSDLRHFISPETWKKFSLWVNQRLRRGENTLYLDALRKCAALEESEPHLKPTQELRVRSGPIDPQTLSDVNFIGGTYYQSNERRFRSRSGENRMDRQDKPRGPPRDSRYSRERRFTPRRFSPRRSFSRTPSRGRENRFRNRSASPGRSFQSPSRRPGFNRDRRQGDRYQRQGDRYQRQGDRYQNKDNRDGRSFRTRENDKGDNRYGRDRSVSQDRYRNSSPSPSPRTWGARSPSPRTWRARSFSSRPPSRSFTPDRSRSGGRDSRERNRGEKTDKYNQNIKDPRDLDRCIKCFSLSHRGASCPRYRKFVKVPCRICIARGYRLMHEPQFCRFTQSDYQSPARDITNQKNV